MSYKITTRYSCKLSGDFQMKKMIKLFSNVALLTDIELQLKKN